MDTIAAIATGAGVSAIGVLRVSGPAALAAAEAVFRPRDGRPLSAHAPRTMVRGSLLGPEGETVDDCLAVFFPAPHSYTGERCVEFHCHGSPSCCGWGSRPSSPRGRGRRGRGSSPARPF